MNKEILTILKLGGKILSEEKLLSQTLDKFSSIEGPKILVHGGGTSASKWQERMGIQPQFVQGRRITDAQSLDLMIMVYAGLLNKGICATLHSLNVNAIGISGVDANAITARLRPVGMIDYGYAGDIEHINTKFFNSLLDQQLVPVCNPITHDSNGQLLNTNADTIATSIAVALANYYHVRLLYCFELPGVMEDLDDVNSLVNRLDHHTYQDFRTRGIIRKGMIPKLDNAFHAVAHKVDHVFITSVKNIMNPEKSTEICA